VPRGVRFTIPPAPVPLNPDRDPGLVAARRPPLAYLTGLRFYADSRRKQRLEVIGVWSGSEVLLKDVGSSFCRTATAKWVRAMAEQWGIDEKDETLAEPIDWERLMRPDTTARPHPAAKALIENAEQAKAASAEVRRLTQGPEQGLVPTTRQGSGTPYLPGFEDL
jgi:hypothetical protein